MQRVCIFPQWFLRKCFLPSGCCPSGIIFPFVVDRQAAPWLHGYTLTHKQSSDRHINTTRPDPRAPGALHLFDLHPPGGGDPSALGLNVRRVNIAFERTPLSSIAAPLASADTCAGIGDGGPAASAFSVLTAASGLTDRTCQRPECPRRATEVASTRTSFCKWLSGQIYRPALGQLSISGGASFWPRR